MYLRAQSYWLSARALVTAKVKHGDADAPIRFLYYHAIELYLKAILRHHFTVAQLSSSRFGHKTDKLCYEALKHGLVVGEHDVELFGMIDDADTVIRARYNRFGPARWPETKALNSACENLNKDVGTALQKADYSVRVWTR